MHDTGTEFGGLDGFGDYGEFSGFGELGEYGEGFFSGDITGVEAVVLQLGLQLP